MANKMNEHPMHRGERRRQMPVPHAAALPRTSKRFRDWLSSRLISPAPRLIHRVLRHFCSWCRSECWVRNSLTRSPSSLSFLLLPPPPPPPCPAPAGDMATEVCVGVCMCTGEGVRRCQGQLIHLEALDVRQYFEQPDGIMPRHSRRLTFVVGLSSKPSSRHIHVCELHRHGNLPGHCAGEV
jgi:hypothetical protein